MSNINVTARNTTITDGLRSYLTQKFNKLDKYLDEDTRVNVKIEVKANNRHKIEVTIPSGKSVVRAEAVDTDMYSAIDKVEEILTRSLRKKKEKMIQRHRKVETPKPEVKTEVEDLYEIVRSKEHELCSITEQEACEEMEMTNHNFYVYRDCARNDAICVVYIREDGKYGQLIFK